MPLQTIESFSQLSLPSIAPDCQTYYKKVVAQCPDKKSDNAAPLVILHGGPLLGHDYCIPLQELARDPNISAVIFYDQIGCGKSTHVPKGNQTFGNDYVAISLYQLKCLVEDLQLNTTGFYLLGHCLGSILGMTYAATNPQGLRALIVASAMTSLADVRKVNLEILQSFPRDVANGIIHFEEHCLGERKEPTVSLKEYIHASEQYRRVHFNRATPPTTEYWNKSRENVMEVMDIFETVAGGRVRFIWGGPVSKHDVRTELHKITAPTLVVKGEYDHVSSYCQEPILRLIPRVQEVTLRDASHIITEEVPAEVCRVVGEFLAELASEKEQKTIGLVDERSDGNSGEHGRVLRSTGIRARFGRTCLSILTCGQRGRSHGRHET